MPDLCTARLSDIRRGFGEECRSNPRTGYGDRDRRTRLPASVPVTFSTTKRAACQKKPCSSYEARFQVFRGSSGDSVVVAEAASGSGYIEWGSFRRRRCCSGVWRVAQNDSCRAMRYSLVSFRLCPCRHAANWLRSAWRAWRPLPIGRLWSIGDVRLSASHAIGPVLRPANTPSGQLVAARASASLLKFSPPVPGATCFPRR